MYHLVDFYQICSVPTFFKSSDLISVNFYMRGVLLVLIRVSRCSLREFLSYIGWTYSARSPTNWPYLVYQTSWIFAPETHKVLISQAARQGLAVLMASASVVLKHETSTLRQRHNFISIDFKNLAWWLRSWGHQPWQSWFGSDERSRRGVGSTYTGTVTFFILQQSFSLSIPVNQF